MTETPRKGKVRHCWNCGADMGFIENRYYDSRDTCESRECARAARDAYEAEKEEAHAAVDDFYSNHW